MNYGLPTFHTGAFAKALGGNISQTAIANFRANQMAGVNVGKQVIIASQYRKVHDVVRADKELNNICTVLLGTICNIAAEEVTDAIGALSSSGMYTDEVRRYARKAIKGWEDFEREHRLVMGNRFVFYTDTVDYIAEQLKQARFHVCQAIIARCLKSKVENAQTKGKVMAAMFYLKTVVGVWETAMEKYGNKFNFDFGKYYKMYRIDNVRMAWNDVVRLTCKEKIDFDVEDMSSQVGLATKIFIDRLYDEDLFYRAQFSAVKMHFSMLNSAQRKKAIEAAKEAGYKWEDL